MSAVTTQALVPFGLCSPGPKELVGYWCSGPGAWVCVADCSHEATGNGGAPGELEAYARLFAAAPDMLAALRQLDNGFKYSAEVCNIARAAIAKAEGRS